MIVHMPLFLLHRGRHVHIGQFPIDVGRAQLARDAVRHEKLCRTLGSEFGEQLLRLCDSVSQDWAACKVEANLGSALTAYDFW